MRRLFLALLAFAPGIVAGQPSPSVHLNQIGFYPDAPKEAVVVGAQAGPFHVLTADGRDTVHVGVLGPERAAPLAGQHVRLADFSALRAPGRYLVAVPGVGRSHPFEVAPRVYAPLARAALKGFYFQRASTALPERYAGAWARPAGHPDTDVRVHGSAATPARPEGTRLAAPKGWYDAGDYNKYIVNSGITTATLLSLYEDYPAYARSLEVDIPESGDAVPDLLDEVLWNLRWMLAMQDPGDGGVYHKLTTPRFEGMVMPHAAQQPRYVIQKSTAATLDFAAVMAQAARVFRAHEAALPGLADSTLRAARAAWTWARRHPNVLYDQEGMNRAFEPDIATGAYGDRDVRDEFVWAAAELYATTREDSFYTAVPFFPDEAAPLPTWSQVRTLGYYTLARHHERLPAAAADLSRVRALLLQAADTLVQGAEEGYGTPMGRRAQDFVWGSSAVAANQGIALLRAYALSQDPDYLRHALANLDYLLGRNATGYAFVTGLGSRTPQHIHHRPSEADGVAAPVPGLLSGGPNPGRQDRAQCGEYPTALPALAFLDDACSYASNEIAINWNAPLVYLAGAAEALQAALALP